MSSDSFLSLTERQRPSKPSVIVIGAGISGIAAARTLSNAAEVIVIDYSLGCPVDMGASWLHGVCNENSLAPIIRQLGLQLYRTSGDNSVLYDHDLESYALFDKDAHQVPQEVVVKVGEIFEAILKETEKVRDEHINDICLSEAVSTVLHKYPHLRLEGLEYDVLQWYVCRMEAWFAADIDTISLKNWDQEHVLTGGHGIMIHGYYPVIKALAENLDIRLNHRVSRVKQLQNKVTVTTDIGTNFVADAVIITVPLGVLKANLIKFEPELPEWKTSAISNLGMGIENKVVLRFDKIFWPNVEVLGMVSETSESCGYFLNLHKVTGNPVLVYMVAGRFASDIEKLSDEEVVNLVMCQLKKILPEAAQPVQSLVSHWGTDPDSLGSYSFDLVGKPSDLYEKFCAPVGNFYFAGEAASMDHSGSVHGAYSSGIAAAKNCQNKFYIQHDIDMLIEPMPPLHISRIEHC